ncbi:hypothetical protein JCM8097_007552 [Rhodosporidiobolus ruineniae]
MFSSASSSSNDSSAANTKPAAVKQCVADGQALPRPTTLLNLPDELLVQVFDGIDHGALTGRTEYTHGGPNATSPILVNKRIYRLARPFWFRRLRIPGNSTDRDAYLDKLIVDKDVHPFVESAELDMYDITKHEPLLTTGFSLFYNLVSLTISFFYGDANMSTALTGALAKLTALRHLRLDDCDGLEDPDFSFDKKVPSLRHLDIAWSEGIHQILDGVSQLTHLTVRTYELVDVGSVPIPWTTLRHLTLKPEANFEGADDLLATFQAALNKVPRIEEFPLERLTFDFYATQSPDDGFDRTHLLALLEDLRQSQLRQLDFLMAHDFEDWPKTALKVESVKVLRLQGSYDLHEAVNLPGLFAFLAMFPSLTTLSMRDFHFSDPPEPVASLAQLSSLDLVLRQPVLNSLLTALSTTATLNFRYSQSGCSEELQWTRQSKEDNFSRQLWLT